MRRAARFRAITAKGKGRGRGRGRGVGGAKKKLDVAAHTTQAEAKAFIPDRVSIWLGKRGEWCGHCKPNKRTIHKFDDYNDSVEALTECLRDLWRQASIRDGAQVSECPIEGLF